MTMGQIVDALLHHAAIAAYASDTQLYGRAVGAIAWLTSETTENIEAAVTAKMKEIEAIAMSVDADIDKL